MQGSAEPCGGHREMSFATVLSSGSLEHFVGALLRCSVPPQQCRHLSTKIEPEPRRSRCLRTVDGMVDGLVNGLVDGLGNRPQQRQALASPRPPSGEWLCNSTGFSGRRRSVSVPPAGCKR